MHNHPKLVTAKTLAARATAGETHAVRLLLKQVQNHRGFTLHGKSNIRYLFEWNPQCNSHALDVPAAVWMEHNAWLAHDLMGHHFATQLVALIVPWKSPLDPRYHKPAADPLPEPDPEETAEMTPEEKAEAILSS